MSGCKACGEALVFRPDDDDNEHAPIEVPDDLELGCGCHFHWQCLMDEAHTVALSLKCPGCESHLPTNEAGSSSTNTVFNISGSAILANYTNEGGSQPQLDILPLITEEAYVANHPETTAARAFQTMCSEGDITGMVELLAAIDGDDEADMDTFSVVRYQDPLSGMKSNLHLAVENAQIEAVLLLLWLCSSVLTGDFPDVARQMAESSSVGRLSERAEDDIRRLKDSADRTAGDLAQRVHGPIQDMVLHGLL